MNFAIMIMTGVIMSGVIVISVAVISVAVIVAVPFVVFFGRNRRSGLTATGQADGGQANYSGDGYRKGDSWHGNPFST